MSSPSWLSRLLLTPLFKALPPSSVEALSNSLELVNLRGGDMLVQQGELGDSLYVLLSGRLKAEVNTGDCFARMVGEVRPGESIGELSLLTGEARSASVRAIRDSELVRLSKEAFDHLCVRHPAAVLSLAKAIATRFRTAHTNNDQGTGYCVAVVPMTKGVQCRDFATRLTESFQRAGKARCVSIEDVDDALGQGAANLPDNALEASNLRRWLNDQECEYPFLVYEGRWNSPNWTRRCMRQVDRILLLVPGEEKHEANSEEVGDMSQKLFGDRSQLQANFDLVILHDGVKRTISGAEKWLKAIPADRYHHILLKETAGYSRLVRFLTGQAIGLVLSGGGARAFAQIGAIRALREANIVIDAVGGTSMGSAIAAQYAIGMDYKTMLAANRECWINKHAFVDYTLPIVAMTTGRMLNKNLKHMFGELSIEDLETPYFCISTDLTRAATVIHQRGLLWKSVRASLSIPGIAPPLFWNGQILVDGALLNNCPVDVMEELYGARVIAVETSSKGYLENSSRDAESVSGWRSLLDRIRLTHSHYWHPSMFDILHCSTMVTCDSQAERSRAKCYMHIGPPVEKFGLFEWNSLSKVAEAGYSYTCDFIQRWITKDGEEPQK